MIRETTGNILAADVGAVVNPVNTVGVMGAGLALQFKRRYPAMFREYQTACQRGELVPGVVIPHLVVGSVAWVISFPTKRDWRDPSRIEWINQGLVGLGEVIKNLEIESIAIPPLGCGLGGLSWPDVRKLIEERLGELDDVDIVLYVPASRRPTSPPTHH